MLQTKEEAMAVYVAWTMGIEIEMLGLDSEWIEHESTHEIEQQGRALKTFYIYMKATGDFDDRESEIRCRNLAFRVSQENTNATNERRT